MVNTIVTSLLAIDDDDFWYRNVVRRQAKRHAGAIASDVPGVFFLEIDGLAHDVLQRAIRDGNAPDIARWLRDGRPPAARAGRPTGPRRPAPARRACCTATTTTCRPSAGGRRTAARRDRHQPPAATPRRSSAAISDGRGLLHEDGASRANILSGDAAHTLLTMSTVLAARGRGQLGHDYFAYFANPYNVARTIMLLAIADIVARAPARDASRRRDDVQPADPARRACTRSMRAWATVDPARPAGRRRSSATSTPGRPGRLLDLPRLRRGRPPLGHRAADDALAVLRQVDRQFARDRSRRRGRAAARTEFVVLSDHGQSQGATFRDRYGVTLEDLVTRGVRLGRRRGDSVDEDEAMDYLGAGHRGGERCRAARRAVARPPRARVGGAVDLESRRARRARAGATSSPSSW